MKHKINEKKHLFYRIFDKQNQTNIDFMTCHGKLSYDEVIDSHLKAWTRSRVYGISASMAFYGEIQEAIMLIDEIATEHFSI